MLCDIGTERFLLPRSDLPLGAQQVDELRLPGAVGLDELLERAVRTETGSRDPAQLLTEGVERRLEFFDRRVSALRGEPSGEANDLGTRVERGPQRSLHRQLELLAT